MKPSARNRRPSRQVWVLRALTLVAAGALAIVSIVALATDNVKGTLGGGIKVASGTFNSNGSSTGNANPSPALPGPSSVGTSESLSSALSPIAPSPAASRGTTGSSPSEPGPSSDLTGPGTGNDVGGSPPPAPSSGAANVAVLSGVLSTFAFGSQVGLPLLCGAAIGGFSPLFSNPVLAKVALTITSSCVSYGNQGAAALTAMNQRLAALAAADPTVNPVIIKLAALFNSLGANGVPFASMMIEIGQMITFFQGS